MKHPILTAISTIIFLLSFIAVNAQTLPRTQTLPKKYTFLFETGKFNLSPQQSKKLEYVLDSIAPNKLLLIKIRGYTDNVGTIESNKILSEQRAATVKALFAAKRISILDLTADGFGSEEPVASNSTSEGRKQNRRVDLYILRSSETQSVDQDITPGIEALYKQLERPYQTFCINRDRDTILNCEQGTKIYVKANSLIPASSCGSSCVTLMVKEDFRKSDMILDNLSTTSNGQILETQGMIDTKAVDCMGNKLELQKGKDLVILIPTDTVKPEAKIFDGHRLHDSVMNWTVNNNEVLSSFSLQDLDFCGGFLCGKGLSSPCYDCPFLFCKIRRVGKVGKGIFSKAQRERNIKFRQCQRELRASTRATAANTQSSNTPAKSDAGRLPICQRLKELFEKYGVKNVEDLILAINKPLMEKYKVATIAQLQDTLVKIKMQEVELSYQDNKLSFTDFNYYVFNSAKFGWKNVDCFSNIPERRKVNLEVNLLPGKNVNCKLVFRQRRAIVSATAEAGKYEFDGVPVGENASIIAIKYENGKPLLAMQEITIARKTFDLEFKELTLEELKAELKKLDL